MDFNQIQDIIRLVHKHKLSEFMLKEGDFKLVVRNQINTMVHNQGSEQTFVPAPAQPIAVAPAVPAPAAAPKADLAPTASAEEVDYHVIKSPMVGTFYRAPSPDKPAFVNVGDMVDVKTEVCVIEAMKLYNKIESEVRGKIVKILVEDNKGVGYDQPLFWVELS